MSPYEAATLVVALIVGVGSATLTAWIQGRQTEKQRSYDRAQRYAEEHDKRRSALIHYERALREESERDIGIDDLFLLHRKLPGRIQDAMEAAYPYFYHLRTSSSGADRGMYWHLFAPVRSDSVIEPHDYREAVEEASDAAHVLLQRFEEEARLNTADTGRTRRRQYRPD